MPLIERILTLPLLPLACSDPSSSVQLSTFSTLTLRALPGFFFLYLFSSSASEWLFSFFYIISSIFASYLRLSAILFHKFQPFRIFSTLPYWIDQSGRQSACLPTCYPASQSASQTHTHKGKSRVLHLAHAFFIQHLLTEGCIDTKRLAQCRQQSNFH